MTMLFYASVNRSVAPKMAGMRDILLVGLLLLLAGNPVVEIWSSAILSTVSLILFFKLILNGSAWSPRFTWSAVGFLVIFLVQAMEFSFFPAITILGFFTRLFVAFSVVTLVRDFPLAYVKTMFFLSIYTMLIYLVDQVARAVGMDFRDSFSPLEKLFALDADHRFVLLHSFMVDGPYRNASFFREPGLYAGYLLLAVLFLLLRSEDFKRTFLTFALVMFLGSLVTTFSTAGYITAPFVLAAWAFSHRDRLKGESRFRVRIFAAILLGSIISVWILSQTADFLGNKLIQELEGASEQRYAYEITRLGGALLDWEAIKERPTAGWGIRLETKYSMTPELAEFSPSGGLSGWARSFGLAGLVIYVGCVWISARGLVGPRAWAAIYVTSVILLISQPNTFLNYPLFLGLMFIQDRRVRNDAKSPAPPR